MAWDETDQYIGEDSNLMLNLRKMNCVRFEPLQNLQRFKLRVSGR